MLQMFVFKKTHKICWLCPPSRRCLMDILLISLRRPISLPSPKTLCL